VRFQDRVKRRGRRRYLSRVAGGPNVAEPTCEDFKDLGAELALGILGGRDRAAALAHSERCLSCRAELWRLFDLANRIISLIPEAQPPVGLEARVLAAMVPRPAKDHADRRGAASPPPIGPNAS
jgi:hypothetical protein